MSGRINNSMPDRSLKMLALTIALLCLGESSIAAPGLTAQPKSDATPEPLVARWQAHHNRHAKGHIWASDRIVNSTVRLTFPSKGRVEVVDSGYRQRSSMERTSSESERVQWSNRWKGTYRRAGRELILALRLKERSCKKVLKRTRRGVTTKTQRACPHARRSLKLRCVEDKFDARLREDRLSSKITVLPVWSCSPSGDRPTFGSWAPWVFGKKHCLIAPTRYRHFYDICEE